MTLIDALVIGSGPSGCAATAALVRAGIRPTVIDGGLRSVPSSTHIELGSKAEPGRKAWLGSTAAYQQPQPPLVEYHDRLLARVSYAHGGFSRVWGATAELPADWADWPEDSRPRPSDLDEFQELLPRATTAWSRDLDSDATSIPGSGASERVMHRVMDACDENWLVRRSTVAIQTAPRAANKCRPCARCLEGCPRHSIWFAGDSIDAWAAADRIDYSPGLTVLDMSEKADAVEVRFRLAGGSEDRLLARRVFVGAGPISSAAVALQSGLVDSVHIGDTATAFTGVVAAKAAPSDEGFHHGLAQWWIHDRGERLLAQIYPPSNQHAARLASRLPGDGKWLTAGTRRAARHLHPVIAYLCQDESDRLVVTRRSGQVFVEPESDTATAGFAARLQDLARVFRRAGYWMPVGATEFTVAGTGYHMGASWPHGRGSDAVGRLPGTERIHFVDASVLPTLRVGSITPTVMVNSMRIAREVSQEVA